MSDNLIDSVAIDCFYGLKSMKTTDLSLNRLTNLTCFVFNNTNMLETLDLSSNLINNLLQNACLLA